MKNLFIIIGAVFSGWNVAKIAKTFDLNYVKVSDFGPSIAFVSFGVIAAYDRFKGLCSQIGESPYISPATGAILRFGKGETDHFYGRAIDVMFANRKRSLDQLAKIAEQAGFNAIGIYPDWRPDSGLHLGIRPQSHVSRWGAIRDVSGQQLYVSYGQALGNDILYV